MLAVDLFIGERLSGVYHRCVMRAWQPERARPRAALCLPPSTIQSAGHCSLTRTLVTPLFGASPSAATTTTCWAAGCYGRHRKNEKQLLLL